MDTNVAGLNKVVCKSDSSHSGRLVKITDGINTWSGSIANITNVGYACIFMIPSMPAPAKKSFTVTLYGSDGTTAEYTMPLELGFGDSVILELSAGKQYTTKEYVDSQITSHLYTLPTAATNTLGGVKVPSSVSISNGVYMNGTNLVTAKASSSQLGCVKGGGEGVSIDSSTGVISLTNTSSAALGGIKLGNGFEQTNGFTKVKAGTGIYVDSSGVGLNTASESSIGGIRIGEGLRMDGNIAKIKPAGSTNTTRGGVYIKSGKGIKLDSDGEIYLKMSRVEANISESGSVSADTITSTSITIPSSNTAFDRLLNGAIEYVYVNNTRILTQISSITKFASSIIIGLWLKNFGNTSQSYSSASVGYVYFES